MSSNKSENLGLHLWEGEDNFLRTEFNENFQILDQSSVLPYVIGEFIGNGTEQTIELGFQPRFLIITRQSSASAISEWTTAVVGSVILTNGNAMWDRVKLVENGFYVAYRVAGEDLASYPIVNEYPYRYAYLAFR